MSKMDDKYIANNDVIKRYLKDKLTVEETIEFEEYILDKPELLEQLELDAILVENYSTALEEVNKEESENSDPSFISIIKALWSRPQVNSVESKSVWSRPLVHSVASFALGVLVVLFINGNNVDSTSYSGTIDLVEVSPLRSSSAQDMPDATYSLSNKADHIMLLLQPGYIDSESVMVKITRRSDNTNLFNKQVAVNSSGDLVVHLKTESLEPGMLQVDFWDKDGTDVSQLLLMISD